MNNSITITTQMCPEDRAMVERLTAALEALAVKPSTTPAEPPKVEERQPSQAEAYEAYQEEAIAATAEQAEPAEQPQEPEQTEPVEQPAEPEPVEQTAEAEPKASLEDVRRLAIELVQAGAINQVKDIVNDYGGKVSAIPADKYDEAFARLTELAALVKAKTEG